MRADGQDESHSTIPPGAALLTRDDISRRRAAFAALHESGCFVIPNPWDVGTARYLRHLGFRALATTSAGFQFSRGQADTVWGVARDAALGHIAEIVAATDLAVNADFQSGYAHEPEGVRTRHDIDRIVRAVAPKPVNVLVMDDLGLAVSDLAALGVRRISVGSALARVAWGAFIRAATAIAEQGSFAGLGGAASFTDLNRVFAGD